MFCQELETKSASYVTLRKPTSCFCLIFQKPHIARDIVICENPESNGISDPWIITHESNMSENHTSENDRIVAELCKSTIGRTCLSVQITWRTRKNKKKNGKETKRPWKCYTRKQVAKAGLPDNRKGNEPAGLWHHFKGLQAVEWRKCKHDECSHVLHTQLYCLRGGEGISSILVLELLLYAYLAERNVIGGKWNIGSSCCFNVSPCGGHRY